MSQSAPGGEITRIGEFPPPVAPPDGAPSGESAVSTAVKALLLGACGADSGSVVGVHGHDGCGKTSILHEVRFSPLFSVIFNRNMQKLPLFS